MSRRFSLLAWVAALVVLALSISHTPARPEPAAAPPEVEVFTCFDSRFGEACVVRPGRVNPHVIHVPQPTSEEERVAAAQRDKAWMARCRPTVQQDRYGMPRYVYAAPDCEYGRLD